MAGTPPRVYSVSQLTSQVKDALEARFPDVWVAGEISDLSQSHAGHLYFSLKDGQAQIRGVMWAGTAGRLPFRPQDGLAVVCRGAVEVYAPRGTYQLIVRQMEPQGEGALQLALRQLQARLAQEGLFDPRRKRPLPPFPRRVAVVTSPTGAAIRDFLEVVRRRWPGLHVTVVPARVQGPGATAELVRGLDWAQRLQPPPEVIVLARGGESLEDLWSFNEEPLVRAVFAARIPVVSAVGHEIDVTLCDLVADVRALTPTEAGERLVPSREQLLVDVGRWRGRLAAALRQRAARARQILVSLEERRCFRRPYDRLHEAIRRVDEWDARGAAAMRARLRRGREQLLSAAQRLAALNPLAVLTRGYSVTWRGADGRVVTDARELHVGDEIRTQFAMGQVRSRVVEVEGPPADTARESTS